MLPSRPPSPRTAASTSLEDGTQRHTTLFFPPNSARDVVTVAPACCTSSRLSPARCAYTITG